jgi:hypothetical protein
MKMRCNRSRMNMSSRGRAPRSVYPAFDSSVAALAIMPGFEEKAV